MAFGLKYELYCTTIKGHFYKAKVYFDGYTFGQIDRNVPISPFKLRKDKADYVRGTSFEFLIREQVDFEFLPFYTNSSKKVKIELYDPSNTLIWVGYNLPQQYQVPYVPPPASVTFTATDGLGLLKSESFGLTGRKSQMEMICYCIDKIGLSLGYSIAIGRHEVSQNTSRSPFEQTFENADVFKNLNCYEVLEKILNKYNAEITQCRGRWAITRGADKKSTRLLYTTAGVYLGTESAPAVINMGQIGEAGVVVYPKSRLAMSLEPGAKQVKIRHDYGRKATFFGNVAFWTSVNGSFTPQIKFDNDGAYVYIPGRSLSREYLYKTLYVENATGDDFTFSLKLAAMGSKLYGGLPVPILMAVYFKIVLTDGVNTRYLTKDGWTATASEITMNTSSKIGGEPMFNDLTIITHEIPFSGNITISLGRYLGMNGVNDSGWTIDGIAWRDVNIYSVNAGQLYPASLETLCVFSNSSEPGNLSDIELLTADAPNVPNRAIYYDNITFKSDGNATIIWPYNSQLINLALDLASENRKAKQKLIGDIKGTTIAFDSIIKHVYNSNREFEIAEGIWDIYEEAFSVTLLELLPWSDETIEITDVTSGNVSSNNNSGNNISTSGGSIIFKSLLDQFQIINEGTSDACMVCKLPFASWYEVMAFADGGQLPPSLWDSLPYATAGSVGGIKVGSGLSITNGVLSVNGGAGMTYPGAGIAISTGSAWGTSITDNSANWNTAYNHSQAAHQAVINGIGFVKASGTTITFDNNTYCLSNDSRLTDARTPVSHTHGNITNAGYLGSTANIPLITGASGIVQAGSFGTTVNTFCQGNDSRLSDSRTASDVYTWAKASVKPSYSASEVGLGNVTNESKATMFTSPTFTGAYSTFTGYIKLNDNTNKAQILLGGTGSNYGVIQSDAADVWSLAYKTTNSNALGTPVLTWNSGGNVGINMTPAHEFDIKAQYATQDMFGILSSDSAVWLSYFGAVSNNSFLNLRNSSNITTVSLNSNGNTYFNGGNVGIGTTSPAAQLEVKNIHTYNLIQDNLILNTTLAGGDNSQPVSYGSIRFAGSSYDWGAIRTIQTNPAASWDSRVAFFGMNGDNGALIERMNYTNNGVINLLVNTAVTGNMTVTGEVAAFYSSDRLFKQDINYQWSGLDLVDKMRPATYHWNSLMKGLNSTKDDRINYGMIADEMTNVTPSLIHTIYEKYQSVDYVQVIPILVKAIQELREEVNQLKYK